MEYCWDLMPGYGPRWVTVPILDLNNRTATFSTYTVLLCVGCFPHMAVHLLYYSPLL
ncbi:hypothetical protein LZ32DRAFT_330516 [Colletotrichum eremochloae]|nr:hypothetical protein LZ32DRAFT_330516 [Colletotrichum eremochloae]